MLDYYRFKDISDLYARGQEQRAKHLLMEMQARYIALCDENSTLRTKIREFEDILFFSKNITFDGDCYWLFTGPIKQGPFCQNCYEQDGTLYRLELRDEQWICTDCGQIHERGRPASALPLLRAAPTPARILPFRKTAQA